MHGIKNACLKLRFPAMHGEDTKLAPFKTKAKFRVSHSNPAFSLGKHPSSQLITHCPAVAGCPFT